MIKNDRYDQRMTTLGSLITRLTQASAPLDIPALAASLSPSLTAAGAVDADPASLAAGITAWTQQDDDAHEPCSLTACRHPLHPGPCKGWKGTLHAVSPGTYHQIEEERVKKANARRVKRIADLRAQGKPIPRSLLTEIKAKPAPNTHAAQNAQTVPLGQVNQKADLAGGQAHTAGQAVSKAAGVQVKTAPPLPLGPKKQKPTVAGRGPAFVITQPKVTDQYKLDKAAKITPQEWDALSDADKKTIRDELAAIKARGFGPQQRKSDELMAKLPAPGQKAPVGTTLKPGTPNTVTTPSGQVHQKINVAPGKVTLGQASKPAPAKTPQLPAPAAGPKVGTRDQNGILNKPLPGGSVSSTSVGLPSGYRITRDGMGYSLKHNGKLIRTSSTQDALEKYAHEHAKGTPAAPAAPAAPIPAVLPAHAQAARAVAARTFGGPPTAKKHLTAYGKLSKDDFDHLDAKTQKTIRDDLANAKAKFLDPKKQQEAKDLLDRFGSRHPAPAAAAPSAPNAPAPHPKGYSDPMNEAVKATSSGLISTDDVLKTVGHLSPDTVAKLDDDDRKRLLGRLAFVATNPKATPDQKAKAAAFGRIINSGSPAQTSRKWDHTPSLAELHTDEQSGSAKDAMKVGAALKAADDKSLPRTDRVDALTGLSKAQFAALKPDEQRKVTDALHELHTIKPTAPGGVTTRDPAVELAFNYYTGLHPAIHQIRQAEADFRAGKIDATEVWHQLLHARVAAPTKYGDPNSPGAKLEAEAERIATDNPKLPTWLRATMIENPYGGKAYYSISAAENKYNYEDAPRLSSSDINDIFRASPSELAFSHPVHAQAVKELREHVLKTGLATGSPWSTATKGHVVDNLLHINGGTGIDEIQADRLKEFKNLPADVQISVERVLRDRINAQTNDHAKTETWLQANQLGGRQAMDLNPAQMSALRQARERVNRPDLDVYRKLDPVNDFRPLPLFARKAIDAHLDEAQQRAERAGPVLTFTGSENMLALFPGALKDHLNEIRTSYPDRKTRQASDIANFGTKMINPFDRTRVYTQVPSGDFLKMSQGDQDLINLDLSRISADSTLSLKIRHDALFTKDFRLSNPSAPGGFTVDQIDAVIHTRPSVVSADRTVEMALTDLDKADYDGLDSVYRDSIDERIKTLPAGSQQLLTAKFHPQAAPAATPGGFTPTAGTTAAPLPANLQAAIDTIYGVHPSGKSHTMAHQLSVYGALRGADFNNLNGQEQGHLLGDLSFIATTAKGPSADKARKLIDRFTPPGTPAGQVPTGAVVPPANAVAGQVRYATPLKGLFKAQDSGKSGDKWISLPGGGRVWGEHGAAGLLLQHTDPNTGEKRYLMVQRGPAISDPGKWTFPGGASDSKETPHQGATRETIEELGLKDDVFKDALVHGDHTFTVPNSTWKYTTVAASVPTMIKPDLSTAHARAETSDAKWMTEAEIKALDASGKLHHPIAGGKLESNVISLFPSATSTKLGQVARPGPVNKRLGRLAMPSGGRQAPANFNAWPHAHKPSKGKDLIPDKATFDAQRQKIKQDRKLYDGKTADGRLAAIGAQQGFDDTPTVLDKKEIDRLLATGDYIEAFRGMSGSGGHNWRSSSSKGKTAAQINEEMRSGPAYYGKGIFGNGYYLATQRRVATQYADGTNGSIARILIPKSAITQKYDKVSKESHKNPRMSKAKGSGYEDATFYDPGRYAAAKGIDGIEIEHHHTSPGGGARHVAQPGQPAFNWLNRSVLIIQKEPG